jgi:hypothetical protein
LRPIATGLVSLRAGNMRLASHRKSWLGDKVNNSKKRIELPELLA